MNKLAIWSVCIVALLLVPMYAKASSMTEYSVDLDYQPEGENNVTINHLDEGASTNAETWNPVVQGVYVGGWAPESQMRLSWVPDEDTELALAQVCYFTPDQIMSGASLTVCRLPLQATWDRAILMVYEIDTDTNWSFRYLETFSDPGPPTAFPHYLNPMRINFTAGSHQLIYFSMNLSASDASVSDGNEVYTRDGRTYVIMSAPLAPETYYLFVTYAWYAPDAYMEIFWSPDSLTSFAWNRSSIGFYNLIEPDVYDLVVDHFEVCLGYSFDFQEGYGQGVCAMNQWFYSGDTLQFWGYIDNSTIDGTDYFSIMIPFYTDSVNVSIRTQVAMQSHVNDESHDIILNTTEWNDFILLSAEDPMQDHWTEVAAWDGWFYILLTIYNDTRLRFYLNDLDPVEDSGFNSSWFYGFGSYEEPLHIAWDSSYHWNPLEFCKYWDGVYPNGNDRLYHWAPYYTIQINPYIWQKDFPDYKPSPTNTGRTFRQMSFGQKLFYVAGSILVAMGDVLVYVAPPLGYALHAAGTAMILVAKYADFPDPFGRIRDALGWAWDKLKGFGTWLWKVGQAIYGAIKWFVEQIIYYGSIILGIIILLLAFVVFFLPIWVSIKLGMVFRSVVFGDLEAAQAHIAQVMAVAQGASSGVKRILRR